MRKISVACSEINYLPEGQTTDLANVLTIQNLIYEPLVRMDSREMRPALAQSWQALDNGRRWLFYIRENAAFSDGTPCTASDVIRSLELAKNATDTFGIPGSFTNYLARLSFSACSRNCVQISCPEPNHEMLDFLSEIYIQKPGDSIPLGTGHYKAADYEAGKSLTLIYRGSPDRFNAYDEIRFIQVPDAANRLEALKKGAVDLAAETDDIAPLRNTSNIDGCRWHYAVSTLSVTGFLNGFEKPFSNPLARLAVNFAVNKQKIIDRIYHGLGVPAATVVSPYHYGYESTLEPIPFSPDKAKELFDKTGFPASLTIRTPQINPAHGEEIANLIKEDLEKIGIKVSVDVQTDRSAYTKEVIHKNIGHLGLFISSHRSVYRILHDKISSRIHSRWWQGVSDEESDRLIDAAHASADPYLRRRAYAKVLNRLNAVPPWLYMFHPVSTFVESENIASNIELTHSGLLRFPGTW